MNNSLIIKTFSEKYRSEIINLWDKCNLLFPGNNPDNDIDIKVRFQPDLFFIGFYGEILVSSLMAGFDGHRGWLNYLGVLPDFRKKGYGKLMIDHAVDRLNNIGCPKINLQVRGSNTGVIEFYKKSGFYMHDVVCMQLKL